MIGAFLLGVHCAVYSRVDPRGQPGFVTAMDTKQALCACDAPPSRRVPCIVGLILAVNLASLRGQPGFVAYHSEKRTHLQHRYLPSYQ